MMNNWSDDLRRDPSIWVQIPVLPSKLPYVKKKRYEKMKPNLKNINAYTIIALIILIAGLLLYITWGLRYNVWYDVGIYSIAIVLILGGLFGAILSLTFEKTEEERE
jgi:hypothetical protein